MPVGQNSWKEQDGAEQDAATRAKMMAMPRGLLPSTNCFRCNSRDWCEHRPKPYGL